MPSSTSSSDRRFLLAAALTFAVLFAIWETVLRVNAGATVEFALERPALSASSATGERWLVFGNCLVMTGISPKSLDEQLGSGERWIVNIAAHEQSPIAFFDYLRRAQLYPDVVLLNVSSWINSTNFEQESHRVLEEDPLTLGTKQVKKASAQQAFRDDSELGAGKLQKRVEAVIADVIGDTSQVVAHKYHLFDFAMFLGTLATSGDLDNALYQLQIQSWFKVTTSTTDGRGWLGVEVDYRSDWSDGVDRMAERYLKRMRFSRMLTPDYWSTLEAAIREFQHRGTRVKLIRMPEHPAIRAFNDETYAVSTRMRELAQRTGATMLDLSTLGPADGVRLFDAVHPDVQAADVITQRIADALRAREL